MEPPSPIEAIGFNPVPSRFINKSSLRRFPVLIEERGIENKGMTVESSSFKQRAARVLQKKMVLFINLLGKGLTQEIHRDGGSI